MRLPFELDPAIIHHIIYSQAGSIGKAIIELIMNAVDAQAKTVALSMSKEGFRCADDGQGFASREDVLLYFGRFGTPHQEGDATYGRFRLGRGQIMAHANTVWLSRGWRMTVDTREMGYHYDLDELDVEQTVAGCDISGRWYEPLTDTELLSALQEIRDLVRYTPVRVTLNSQTITRDPAAERWDFEDDYAWYRAQPEGAVSIYNQGVLVRHDASQQWGCGGLIVSKQAIALNVSRTEILRKTCPVWQPIAKQFRVLAKTVIDKLGANRKTEAMRQKAAHDLVSGADDMLSIFEREEVITLLPGKRHVSMAYFMEQIYRKWKGEVCPMLYGSDVPKGEALAKSGVALFVHPATLTRFNCHNAHDLEQVMEQMLALVRERVEAGPGYSRWGWRSEEWLVMPRFLVFEPLAQAFVERTFLVPAKEALDKETRRLWTALSWCVQHHAGQCAGNLYRRDDSYYGYLPKIFLGESNTADAWTDGESYIAFNVDIIKQLRKDPLKTAGRVLSLAEHEVAHQGDSLDCGHDEAFYQRYHDISIEHAAERQRYMHLFIQKMVYSMEGEGQRQRGKVWWEQRLVERANAGREKREMGPVIEDQSAMAFFKQAPQPEDAALIESINEQLSSRKNMPPAPDWDAARDSARQEHDQAHEAWAKERAEFEAWMDEAAAADAAQVAHERPRIAQILGIDPSDLTNGHVRMLIGERDEDLPHVWASLREVWTSLPEDGGPGQDDEFDDWEFDSLEDEIRRGLDKEMNSQDPRDHLDSKYHGLLQPGGGETWWSLERNAAAAGFFRVQDYLVWRDSNN